MTISARRRFSASGIWRASTPASRSAVMPGRAMTRASWIRRGALTTMRLVAAPLAAGLEQQRDIEHHQPAALAPGPGEEAALGRAHQRMQDPLQALEGGRIGEDLAAQGDAVDGAVLSTPGKAAATAATAAPPRPEQAMDGLVGVMHGDAAAGAASRAAVRFAHAHRSRQAEDDHRRSAPRARSRASAGVTSGSTPNQAAKPGRA